MIGESVSHYHITDRFDRGGTGVVYRAVETRLGRSGALELLAERLLAERGANF